MLGIELSDVNAQNLIVKCCFIVPTCRAVASLNLLLCSVSFSSSALNLPNLIRNFHYISMN